MKSSETGSEQHDHERLYDIIYYVGIALVSVAAFAMFVYLGSTTSLWLDEIFQVDYSATSSLAEVITVDPYTPPLFNIIAWVTYQLAPFGEIWLRLPSIIMVVLSLPLLAATGRRIGGRRSGFLVAFLILINAKVLDQCALTYRAYALLFLLSSALVYLYVRRIQSSAEDYSWVWSILTAVDMLLLGYTHYFGLLFCIMFFLVDCYLLIRGRLNGMRLKVFIPYGAALLLYLPWLIIALSTLQTATNTTGRIIWQATGAEGTNVHELLYWLCGECAETLGFFEIAALVLVIAGIWTCYKRTFVWREDMPPLVLLLAAVLMITIMKIYCGYINPQSMFWVERYFIPLIPCISLVTAWGLTKIFANMPVPDPLRFVAAFFCVLLLLPTASGTINNDLAEGSSTRFYRDLTDYLCEQPYIENDDTAILALIDTTDRGRQINGWKEYYFDRKDTREMDVNIIDGLDASVEMNPYDLLKYETIYVTCQHYDPEIPEPIQNVLSKYYRRHKTDNPGGGKTYKYTRTQTLQEDTAAAEDN